MGIPVMSLLPPSAAAPTNAAPHNPASGQGANNGSGGFNSLLASLSTAPIGASHEAPTESQRASGGDAKAQLEQLLSSLAGGKVDLSAPGLGLTAQQQQRLLANLKKLLDDSSGDGAELLASILAAGQLAATIQPNDLAALTQLLGTTAQGSVSVDALKSNLHLLAQAIQLVVSSGGEMTLTQAVEQLTPPGDAFTQQFAAAMAQPDTSKYDVSDVPVGTETGPPIGASPGEASTQASATAGSNGREMTVTPNGATSPADGAAEGANSTDVSALAKAIEALLQTQPQSKTAQPGSKDQVPPAANDVTPAVKPDPATQLASMAPTQAAASQGKPSGVPTVNQAPAPATKQTEGQAADGTAATSTATSSGGPSAHVMPQSGTQDRNAGRNDNGSSASAASTIAQPAAGAIPAPAPNTFAAALNASHAAMETPARPAAVEQAIVDQVVQSATLALNSGQQEFRIQLKPEFLGAMEVRVSVDNGVVDVRMSVESAATRQLIDNNLNQLRQAFGNGEVRVQHVPSFATSDAPWSFSQGGQPGFWQGQNPYAGRPLPEAIPFSNSEAEATPAVAAGSAAPIPTSPAASPAGIVDLQA